MTWLGGGGYTFLGLSINGVNYSKRDGSKIHGAYIAVLFENLCDPIITGREELGFPKLFADIEIQETEHNGCSIKLSWRGAEFGRFDIANLIADQPTASDVNENPAIPGPGPGPPPSPPEAGEFGYRYIAAVGEPGKVDAEYAVFCPFPGLDTSVEPPEKLMTKSASISFEAMDWQSLPTLHSITRILAEIPLYSIERAERVKGSDVNDLMEMRRIE